MSLSSVCLREATLSHGGGLLSRGMALCGDVAVVKAVVIETGVVVEARSKGVQAMRQRHVEEGEIIEVQRHGGHVIGRRAAESHVRRVVFHDELDQDLKGKLSGRCCRGKEEGQARPFGC